MRQDEDFSIFTVNIQKRSISLILTVLIGATAFVVSGCKNRTTIEIPKAILEAKTATREELVHIVNAYDEIQTLQGKIKAAEYTSQEKEYNQIELEKYPKAPGYFLLKRPDTTYLVIQNPVIKKRELSLLSVGDEFKVWVHGKNRFYIGKNSAKELISDDLKENPKITIRATHVYQAILPDSIPAHDPDIRISIIETQDEHAKYYDLMVYREGASLFVHPQGEYRIERSGLTLCRQRIFDEEGRVAADISYSEITRKENYLLPGKINIERPLDGYTLNLEIKDWRINPVLEDDTFTLEPPPGVKVILFR